jgi:putative membrane protein
MKSAGQGSTRTRKTKSVQWTFFEKIAFLAFLVWSGAGLLFTFQHITAGTISHWNLPRDLITFIQFCLQYGDPILIFLAFTNTHLHAAHEWSAGVARTWALIILPCAFGIEMLGARTGIPFGDYRYTDAFGPMLWGVPLAIPLAWHVVVTNALFLVRAVIPNASRLIEAVFAGLICTLYDFVLEPFATTVKHYWIWVERGIPPINYAAWFGLSALLIGIFAPAISSRYRLDPRPLLILLITVLIFIAGQLK